MRNLSYEEREWHRELKSEIISIFGGRLSAHGNSRFYTTNTKRVGESHVAMLLRYNGIKEDPSTRSLLSRDDTHHNAIKLHS